MMQLILPIAFIAAGLLTGLICENFLFPKLKKIVLQKHIPGTRIIFQALHRVTFLWFILAGFSFALVVAPNINTELKILIKQIITVLFLFSVTLVFARLTAGFINIFTRKADGISASLISNLAKLAVLVLGTLIVLQTIGI